MVRCNNVVTQSQCILWSLLLALARSIITVYAATTENVSDLQGTTVIRNAHFCTSFYCELMILVHPHALLAVQGLLLFTSTAVLFCDVTSMAPRLSSTRLLHGSSGAMVHRCNGLLSLRWAHVALCPTTRRSMHYSRCTDRPR